MKEVSLDVKTHTKSQLGELVSNHRETLAQLGDDKSILNHFRGFVSDLSSFWDGIKEYAKDIWRTWL